MNPPVLMTPSMRETTEPANSRVGKSEKTPGATTKLKNTDAPSQMAINSNRISRTILIGNLFRFCTIEVASSSTREPGLATGAMMSVLISIELHHSRL